MVSIVHFDRPQPRPPPCHDFGRLLRRDVLEGEQAQTRLRALLELPRYFAVEERGWWWLMREGANALVAAARQLVSAFPTLGAAQVALAELELLHTWSHCCRGWPPPPSPLGGPSRGLFRALSRLSVRDDRAEAIVQVLQSHTFNKAPGCLARWLEFLRRELSPTDLLRVERLSTRTSPPGEVALHAERLRQLAFDFAGQCATGRIGLR